MSFFHPLLKNVPFEKRFGEQFADCTSRTYIVGTGAFYLDNIGAEDGNIRAEDGNIGAEDDNIRAAIRFYNGMLSSNSATLKQTLRADLKLVPQAKTSWASDILRAFEVLRGCDTYTQAFLCTNLKTYIPHALPSQTVFNFLSQLHNRLCHFISDLMDYFLAGEDQQQTKKPNDLAVDPYLVILELRM